LARFLKSIVDARAVRNAVISSALIKARGVPALSRMARRPRGAVEFALETEGRGMSEAEVEDVVDWVESESASIEGREPLSLLLLVAFLEAVLGS
jgi:hypothetical protein